MKTMNSFCTSEMEVQLKLFHLFLLYVFCDSRQAMETFVPVAAPSRKFHQNNSGRNKFTPCSSLLLLIRCLKLLFICLNVCIFLFITCSVFKKKTIKVVRPMNVLRIDKPVTIGFTSFCTTYTTL